MLIDAYSGRDRQHAVQIMQGCADDGLDLAGCMDALEKYSKSVTVMQKSSPMVCPQCGRGYLGPVRNRENLNIIGCKQCRYSEVVG